MEKTVILIIRINHDVKNSADSVLSQLGGKTICSAPTVVKRGFTCIL